MNVRQNIVPVPTKAPTTSARPDPVVGAPGSVQSVSSDFRRGQTEYVAQLFNEMAEEYDNLNDLWYRYTFGEIDKILIRHFQPNASLSPKPIALDVGCGTGIQSLRLASLGYKVVGVDIAANLLQIAREKLVKKGCLDAEFHIRDAQCLPFDDAFADCVNCCGPTLSFAPDWEKALSEISRCLKPGGKLLLEVEGKWNPDLFWEIINAMCLDCFGYNEGLGTALSHLLPPWTRGHLINYSFKLESGQSVTMPLKLFAASELRSELDRAGLIQQKRWALHFLTNLIPSTVLHRANPSRRLKAVFDFLATLERKVSGSWPCNSFGCSLLVLASKPALEEKGD